MSYGSLEELRFLWWRATRRCGKELSFQRVGCVYRAIVQLGDGYVIFSTRDVDEVVFVRNTTPKSEWVFYYTDVDKFGAMQNVRTQTMLLYESHKDFAKFCALLFPEMVARYTFLTRNTTDLYWKHFRSYLCFFWIFKLNLPRDLRKYIWCKYFSIINK